jgi:hypothetical protein
MDDSAAVMRIIDVGMQVKGQMQVHGTSRKRNQAERETQYEAEEVKI